MAEAEPKGKMIVESSGEVLRSLDKDALLIQISTLCKSTYYSSGPICCPYY